MMVESADATAVVHKVREVDGLRVGNSEKEKGGGEERMVLVFG
jgi:hypothetical protein